MRGESFALFAVLAGAWALATARFARWPAEAIDSDSALWTQLLAGYATAVLALGPAIGHGRALGVDALPVLLFVALGWTSKKPREGSALAFAVCAPAYLIALAAIRIHLVSSPTPGLAIYAPLGALWSFGVLRVRQAGERPPTAFAIGVVAVQAALSLAAVDASCSAAALCFGLLAFTSYTLAGEGKRAGWEYVAAGSGWLAVIAAGAGHAAAWESLGRALVEGGPWMPAVIALTYAAAVIALGAMPVGEPARRSVRTRAGAAVLLATGALAVVETFSLPVSPPRGFLLFGILAVLGIGAGLAFDRAAWVSAGASVLLGVPLVSGRFEPPGLPSAILAAALAALSSWRRPCVRRAPSRVAIALALAGLLFALVGWQGSHWTVPFAASLFLSAGALTWIGAREQRRWVVALGGAAFACLATLSPFPEHHVLSVAAVVLALVSAFVDPLEGLGWTAAVLAPAAIAFIPSGGWGSHAVYAAPLGPSLALAAVTYGLLSRRMRPAAVLAVICATAALLPPLGDSPRVIFWPGLVAPVSLAGYAVLSLLASVWTARRGRALAVTALGWCTLGFSLLVLAQGWLGDAVEPSWSTWIAVAGALFACRVLPAELALGWASVLALVAGHRSPMALWAIASALTVLGQSDSLPRLRRALFGPRSAAQISAAFALLACIPLAASPSVFALVAICLYPLLWLRATRRSFYLAMPALLGALFANKATGVESFAIALAVTAVAARGLWHLPRVRTAFNAADGLEQRAARAAWIGAVAGAVFLAVLPRNPEALGLAAGALLLLPGDPLGLRLALAAACVAFVPELRPVGVGALALIGVSLRRAEARSHRWLGSSVRSESTLWVTVASLALAVIAVALGGPVDALVGGAAAIVAALVLDLPWLSIAAFAAWLSIGFFRDGRLLLDPRAWQVTTAVAAVATVLSLLSRLPSTRALGQRVVRWVRPGAGRAWAPALECSALMSVAVGLAFPVVAGISATPALSIAMGICALALLATTAATGAWVSAGLFAIACGNLLPTGWFAVGGSIAALACVALALWRDESALLDVAMVLAAVAVVGTRSLKHPSLPWTLGAALAVAWDRARREPAWQKAAWIATLIAAHVGLLHVGAVLSTGRPPQHVLPFAAAASAVCAVLALFLARQEERAELGEGFSLLALIEAGAAWWLISGREPFEASVLGISLALLALSLVLFAVREEDARAAYLAELALFIGYLGVRSLATGGGFGRGDVLVSILGGAVLGGLAGWAHRQTSALEVLAGPARLGAYLVPIAGLFALPFHEPLVAAALLAGHAAHFAALARDEDDRRGASIASAVAFNGALLLAWSANRAISPELFLVPAGVSLLMLVRVFRDDLSPETEARLRAVAVTGIYASAAFRPLMFPHTTAFLACVAICLLGVCVGIALRIRSYVYLGTAFLVTSVLANLVRFGVRDHRAGAAFLSLLGLLVVGGMILLSARRAELIRRYDKLRALLASWEA